MLSRFCPTTQAAVNFWFSSWRATEIEILLALGYQSAPEHPLDSFLREITQPLPYPVSETTKSHPDDPPPITANWARDRKLTKIGSGQSRALIWKDELDQSHSSSLEYAFRKPRLSYWGTQAGRVAWGRLETMVSKDPLASKVMQGQRNSLSQNEQRGGPEPWTPGRVWLELH